jgi:N-acetylglucosamine malate deacetylase 1
MNTVMVFAAHSDDEIIGCGGTIAKFAEEGKKVIVVIFTSGELSSPWLKRDVIVSNREKESEKIARYIGADTVVNLGFKDGNLKNIVGESEIQNQIKDLLVKYGPESVFVHSKYDRHPGGDHKAVNSIVLDSVERFDPQKKISTFIYEVWNISNEVSPRYYVDISKTFDKKVKAMRMFKSQWLSVGLLLVPVFVRAKISGFHSGNKYAERFYKIR